MNFEGNSTSSLHIGSRGKTAKRFLSKHLLCSRTLRGSDATLPPSPWMIAFTLSVGMMADRGWVRLSVWTTRQMKMESGTLSPQWMYAEALQELQPSEVTILYGEIMLFLTHSLSSSGFLWILGQGGLRLWRFTGTWALNEAAQFTWDWNWIWQPNEFSEFELCWFSGWFSLVFLSYIAWSAFLL